MYSALNSGKIGGVRFCSVSRYCCSFFMLLQGLTVLGKIISGALTSSFDILSCFKFRGYLICLRRHFEFVSEVCADMRC